jgi:hypothetical protein
MATHLSGLSLDLAKPVLQGSKPLSFRRANSFNASAVF